MFNLGPLLLLDDFVKEILASGSTKSYLGKERAEITRLVTNDLNKSAAMDAIGKRIFWNAVFGPGENCVKVKPRYGRSILVLKPQNGEFDTIQSPLFQSFY